MSSYQKQDESSISSLCPRCKAMTTTITGLKQLFSKTGYVHPYPSILYGSSDGCRFCIILKQLALLRIEEVPNPVHISCAFPVDGSNEFDDLVYRGQSCSDDEFQRLYESLPPGAFRPGIFITFQGHAFGPDYCASLDVKALPEFKSKLMDTFTEVDFEQMSPLVNKITDGIKTCSEQHKLCPDISKSSTLPSRVIDVQTVEQDPFLHISQSNELGKYLALSYCWGGPQRVTLTLASQSSMEKGISFGSLPNTIRDAITVCRALNYQYLWVDALCIIQDSEEDKSKVINAMGAIFANAALTIMASNTPSVEQGFLSSARPSHTCDLPFLLPSRETTVVRCSLSPPTHISDHNPGSRRGWIFQEDKLSVRQLQFHPMSIRWLCAENAQNLTSSMSNRSPKSNLAMPAPWTVSTKISYPEIEEWWRSLLVAYSSREFTFPDDRLPALSGIITYLMPMLEPGNTYLAGLWKSSIISQLRWTRDAGYPLKNPPPVPTKRLRGPTWSWVSLASMISISSYESIYQNPRPAKLVSCTIELANPEMPLGQVKQGILVLEACIAPAPRIEIGGILGRKLNIAWDCQMESETSSGEDSEDIWLLLQHGKTTYESRISALVLRPTTNARYIRVGAVIVEPDIHHLVWPDANLRERITIV